MKLTKAVIDGLVFEGTGPKDKDIRWDERVPGFGLRIAPSGAKSFVFKYRNAEGRQRYLTLGKYGPMTPDQAVKAAALRHASVLQGNDPQDARRKARQGETVADLARAYIERHAKPRNKRWEDDQERLELYVLGRPAKLGEDGAELKPAVHPPVPGFRNLKVASVRQADIAALHDKIGKTRPTTANRVLALLSSMFNRARVLGFLPQNAGNPAKDIQHFPEVKRDRFVTRDEMPRLVKAIDAEPNPFVQVLIWLYLLTGLRKTELLSLRWDAVDIRGSQIRLADTKAGRPHYLPLSSPARMMLERIPRMAGNPFVFPGGKRRRHLVNISKPWLRIREAAKLEDVRLHDLRRTVGSWLAESGSSLPLIGRVLNHTNVSTTQIYARFQQDPVATALEDHARRLGEAVGDHGSLLSGLSSFGSDSD